MLLDSHYSLISVLGSAIYQYINIILRTDYFAAFCSWISRLEKYISVNHFTDICANSIAPDEMAPNEPSHLELHCHSVFFILN